MSEIAVRVEKLGKCYQIGQAKSGEFRESFSGWMDKLRGRNNGKQAESKEFWALKDLNFEIKKGEAVGIIGRNGAGKSTLLKILSRITEPTKGRFEINGRVSSLLEVGTGFHPELSGRENIYLNGTILGMKRKEIKAKFDEILAFSGVEKFIDTPVKHYSSGMKVRLAFSVAAHLEPEILIIDEVLAVGDAEFQKKCLGKMDEVSKNEGRTVLFVSHNMGAVQNLCERGLLLKDGSVLRDDKISGVIDFYKKLTSFNTERKIVIGKEVKREGRGNAEIVSIELFENHEPVEFLSSGEDAVFKIGIRNKQNKVLTDVELSAGIDDALGNRIIHFSNHLSGDQLSLTEGINYVNIHFPKMPLMQSSYNMTLHLTSNGVVEDWLKNIYSFDVESGDFYGNGRLPRLGKAQYLINQKFEIANEFLQKS